MDVSCLQYCLTESERSQFEETGYLIVEDALPEPLVRDLNRAADLLVEQYRTEHDVDAHTKVNPFDFIGKDDVFLDLLDWPRTFPKVWGILGWHIQLYHTHMMTVPPLPPGEGGEPKRKGWHQDSGQLNTDLETDPRPRVSVKVGFFLTDTTTLDSGNVYVIPGSHLSNNLALPDDGVSDPEGAIPLQVKAGSAIVFDRRVWHASGPNRVNVTRKVLYYGYSYRWLRPRDDMTVDDLLDRSDPIRRQLLGASATGGHGYTSPKDADVPLREWIRDNIGEEAVVP